MTTAAHPSAPKRSPWPYAIAGYFAVAITGIVIFITWAVRQNVDPVRADYYEQEILFQSQIDAAHRTRPFQAQLSASYDASSGALRIRIPAEHVTAGFSGQVHLYRPSDARLDRRIALAPDQNGEQLIRVDPLAAGRWKVHVEWTVGGDGFRFEREILAGE